MKPSLITKRFAQTSYGRIAYVEAGEPSAPSVLLLHGIPTSSYLWRHVMAELARDFHCIAPDLMGLGDTEVDASTDLSMPAQAEMLGELLTALGIGRAHVIAHDQGGAAAQIFAVRNRARADRLVLSDCVAFDNWPVPTIRALQKAASLPLVGDWLLGSGLLELHELRTPRSRFRRGVQDRAAMTDEAITEYLRPLGDARGRERFRRFLRAGSAAATMNVVPALREWREPVLILWASEDRYLSPDWGRRLYEAIPGALRFEVIEGAGHFWPEERPGPFCDRIRAFLTDATITTVRTTRAPLAGRRPLPVIKPARLECGGRSATMD